MTTFNCARWCRGEKCLNAQDNIERAIKKGTGELEGGRLEEGSYEGYAAGGIAVVVKVLSDNKNRSASEVRHAFSKHGANMAEQGR